MSGQCPFLISVVRFCRFKQTINNDSAQLNEMMDASRHNTCNVLDIHVHVCFKYVLHEDINSTIKLIEVANVHVQ